MNEQLEIKTMACGQKVTYNRGYTGYSCTGYEDNRFNCSTCIAKHKFN